MQKSILLIFYILYSIKVYTQNNVDTIFLLRNLNFDSTTYSQEIYYYHNVFQFEKILGKKYIFQLNEDNVCIKNNNQDNALFYFLLNKDYTNSYLVQNTNDKIYIENLNKIIDTTLIIDSVSKIKVLGPVVPIINIDSQHKIIDTIYTFNSGRYFFQYFFDENDYQFSKGGFNIEVIYRNQLISRIIIIASNSNEAIICEITNKKTILNHFKYKINIKYNIVSSISKNNFVIYNKKYTEKNIIYKKSLFCKKAKFNIK